MGFRFQQRISLFPGVRLNLSKSGISTTIGVRGAGVTLGRQGAYLNLGLPGTGLSYRTRIAPASRPSVPPPVPSDPARPARPLLSGEGAIASGPVAAMTSPGLGELKRLINAAAAHRATLDAALRAAESTRAWATGWYGLARLPLLRLLAWPLLPRLRARVAAARDGVDALRAERAASLVNLDFGFDAATLDRFQELQAAFRALGRAGRVWDVTASYFTDRLRERAAASVSVSRTPVTLSIAASDLINSGLDPLRFGNANGEDVLLYPGFVLMRAAGGDFALVDLREVTLTVRSIRFVEEEPPPADARIVGRTWKKANKDGSRDRRFAGNYEIPVALYGEIELASPTGLREAYQVSDEAAARAFGTAFQAYRQALATLAATPQLAAADPEEEGALPPTPAAVWPPLPERPRAATLLVDAGLVGAGLAAALLLHPAVPPGGSVAPGLDARVVAPAAPAPVAPVAPAIPPPAAPPPARAVVKVSAANVRAEPAPTAAVRRTVPRSTVLAVAERRGDWLRLADPEGGWVHVSTVALTAP